MSTCSLCAHYFEGHENVERRWHCWIGVGTCRIILVFILLTTHTMVLARNTPPSSETQVTQDCHLVSRTYLAMNLPVEDVPKTPLLSGRSLETCSIRSSCCSDTMLEKLQEKAWQFGTSVFKDAQLRVVSILSTRIELFMRMFQSHIDTSYKNVNVLLDKTYGVKYQQNKELITSLFSLLNTYHPGRTDRVNPILDHFFRQLFRKMMVQLNTKEVFNEKYLLCAENQIASLRPFDGKALSMSSELANAFVTTRTYINGLQVAKRLFDLIFMQMKIPYDCWPALLRLRYCNLCSGQPAVLPCPTSCLRVVRGCLSQHALLQPHWTSFIDNMSTIAERILGPNNFENVLTDMGIKISDAIMAFQAKNEPILQKLRQSCGQFAQSKNSSTIMAAIKSSSHDNAEPLSREERSAAQSNQVYSELVKESINALKKTRTLWTTIPEEQLCAPVQGVPSSNIPCWNGTSSITQASSNVLENTPTTTVHPIISRSIALLKRINDNLARAANREDVDYIVTGYNDINLPAAKNSASSLIDSEGNSGDEGSGGQSTHRAGEGAAGSRAKNGDVIDNELGSGGQPTAAPIGSPTTATTAKIKQKEMTKIKTPHVKDPLVEIDLESSGGVLPTNKPLDPDAEPGPDDGTSGDKPLLPIDNNASGEKIAPTTESLPIMPPVVVPEIDDKKGSQEKPIGSHEINLWPVEKINNKGGNEAGVGTGSVKQAMKSEVGEHVCQPPSCTSQRATANCPLLSVLLVVMLITLLL